MQVFDSANPLSARLRFRLRMITNILVVLVIFIPAAFILARFSEGSDIWVAYVVAIAAMFFLYFFILDKRAIGMQCNHCHKYIKTNTPWVGSVIGTWMPPVV